MRTRPLGKTVAHRTWRSEHTVLHLRPLLAALLLFLSGCVSLSRGPVSQNVVECRQLSFRGIDAVQRGDWAQAEVLFGRAIEACPTDEVAHERYAEALWRRGMHKEALHHMETAMELSGGGPAVRVRLGQMYLSRGTTAAASREAEKAIQMQPKSADGWALLGDVRRSQGNFAEAMRHYHRAVDLQPHYPHVQTMLSELYLQQRRPGRALATIDALAEVYPPGAVPPPVLVTKGIALKQLGRFSGAVEVLSQATQQGHASADLLFELAEAQWFAGNTSSARMAVQAALAESPHDARATKLHEQILIASKQVRDGTGPSPPPSRTSTMK